MKKQIKNFPDYSIDDQGKVYSNKYLKERELKPWADSKNRYLYVSLSENGIKTNYSIHRLVAENFLPNPNNYTDVDHINNNTKDNRLENLRWCSHKDNIHYSYKTLNQVRNYKVVDFRKAGKHLYYFQSISLACQYAKQLGYSYFSLQKYLHTGDIELLELDVTTIENEEIIKSLTEVE